MKTEMKSRETSYHTWRKMNWGEAEMQLAAPVGFPAENRRPGGPSAGLGGREGRLR